MVGEPLVSKTPLLSVPIPPIDPFDDIDPLINDNEAANEANQLQAICASTAEELLLDYSRHEE